MNPFLKIIPVAAVLIGAAAAVHASDRPTRAEMRAAIESLGVSPQDFRACAQGVRNQFGEPQESERAAPERRAALVSCLQEANPDLTEDALVEAFASLRLSN